MRIGSGLLSMARTCIGEVCVRRRMLLSSVR